LQAPEKFATSPGDGARGAARRAGQITACGIRQTIADAAGAASLLEQAIGNLLDNAIGFHRITLRSKLPSSACCRAEFPRDHGLARRISPCRICSSASIAAASGRKPQGTGLGLAFVRVANSQHRVEFANATDAGAWSARSITDFTLASRSLHRHFTAGP
jgi:hypothetical protein